MPITVASATEDHSIRFHQYHLEDMGQVRVRKYCEIGDREVDQGEIGKGYHLTKDYLAPSGHVAAKPYKLLRMALDRSSKVAVAKYAWSGRERLGLLRVRDDVIVLHAMRWPDEIRSPEELLPPPVELSDEEIDGALALMDTMTRDDLEGEEFQDTYTEALAQIIEAKREHREPPKLQEPEAEPGQIVDLMAALTESVQKARASRGEDADVHEMPKKKAAKMQPAKKATAKKTTKRPPQRRRPGAGRAAPSRGTPVRCRARTAGRVCPPQRGRAVPAPG
ncbi:putative DNA repair protein [Streptomyces afghaniensis 772]|uniref:Putative DNA repair protein n=1 Tax=Streptomyces afghaniensis 772 TaxID=1283301 RepID=S4N1H0_9ACTN|nr:Ku protein [Streptomyces afghaniensis]EPJ42620.1 putative DNA repair protein [Streptomyces afghaniensis 772]